MEQNDLVAIAVPAGFEAGQTLTVTSPSGVTAHVVIPPGIAAGSTFTASIPKPTPTVVAVAEAVPVAVVEVEMEPQKAALSTSSTTTTTTSTTAANGPVPRLCCHICSYILAGLMFICGVISVILLWTALALDNGQIVGYFSALFGFFLTIYGVLAPSVVGCVGCNYRTQTNRNVVVGFRIGGWIFYAFACINCFSIWSYYGAYESGLVSLPPSWFSIVWIIVCFGGSYVLLCIDAEISRADLGFGNR